MNTASSAVLPAARSWVCRSKTALAVSKKARRLSKPVSASRVASCTSSWFCAWICARDSSSLTRVSRSSSLVRSMSVWSSTVAMQPRTWPCGSSTGVQCRTPTLRASPVPRCTRTPRRGSPVRSTVSQGSATPSASCRCTASFSVRPCTLSSLTEASSRSAALASITRPRASSRATPSVRPSNAARRCVGTTDIGLRCVSVRRRYRYTVASNTTGSTSAVHSWRSFSQPLRAVGCTGVNSNSTRPHCPCADRMGTVTWVSEERSARWLAHSAWWAPSLASTVPLSWRTAALMSSGLRWRAAARAACTSARRCARRALVSCSVVVSAMRVRSSRARALGSLSTPSRPSARMSRHTLRPTRPSEMRSVGLRRRSWRSR